MAGQWNYHTEEAMKKQRDSRYKTVINEMQGGSAQPQAGPSVHLLPVQPNAPQQQQPRMQQAPVPTQLIVMGPPPPVQQAPVQRYTPEEIQRLVNEEKQKLRGKRNRPPPSDDALLLKKERSAFIRQEQRRKREELDKPKPVDTAEFINWVKERWRTNGGLAERAFRREYDVLQKLLLNEIDPIKINKINHSLGLLEEQLKERALRVAKYDRYKASRKGKGTTGAATASASATVASLPPSVSQDMLNQTADMLAAAPLPPGWELPPSSSAQQASWSTGAGGGAGGPGTPTVQVTMNSDASISPRGGLSAHSNAEPGTGLKHSKIPSMDFDEWINNVTSAHGPAAHAQQQGGAQEAADLQSCTSTENVLQSYDIDVTGAQGGGLHDGWSQPPTMTSTQPAPLGQQPVPAWLQDTAPPSATGQTSAGQYAASSPSSSSNRRMPPTLTSTQPAPLGQQPVPAWLEETAAPSTAAPSTAAPSTAAPSTAAPSSIGQYTTSPPSSCSEIRPQAADQDNQPMPLTRLQARLLASQKPPGLVNADKTGPSKTAPKGKGRQSRKRKNANAIDCEQSSKSAAVQTEPELAPAMPNPGTMPPASNPILMAGQPNPTLMTGQPNTIMMACNPTSMAAPQQLIVLPLQVQTVPARPALPKLAPLRPAGSAPAASAPAASAPAPSAPAPSAPVPPQPLVPDIDSLLPQQRKPQPRKLLPKSLVPGKQRELRPSHDSANPLPGMVMVMIPPATVQGMADRAEREKQAQRELQEEHRRVRAELDASRMKQLGFAKFGTREERAKRYEENYSQLRESGDEWDEDEEEKEWRQQLKDLKAREKKKAGKPAKATSKASKPRKSASAAATVDRVYAELPPSRMEAPLKKKGIPSPSSAVAGSPRPLPVSTATRPVSPVHPQQPSILESAMAEAGLGPGFEQLTLGQDQQGQSQMDQGQLGQGQFGQGQMDQGQLGQGQFGQSLLSPDEAGHDFLSGLLQADASSYQDPQGSDNLWDEQAGLAAHGNTESNAMDDWLDSMFQPAPAPGSGGNDFLQQLDRANAPASAENDFLQQLDGSFLQPPQGYEDPVATGGQAGASGHLTDTLLTEYDFDNSWM